MTGGVNSSELVVGDLDIEVLADGSSKLDSDDLLGIIHFDNSRPSDVGVVGPADELNIEVISLEGVWEVGVKGEVDVGSQDWRHRCWCHELGFFVGVLDVEGEAHESSSSG